SALESALAPLSAPPMPAAGAPPPSFAPPPRLAPPPPPFQQQTAGIGLPPPMSAAPVAPPPYSAAPMPPPSHSPAMPPHSHAAAGQGLAPLRARDFAQPGETAYRGTSAGGGVPEPRDVLEALQIAGVYEPDGQG